MTHWADGRAVGLEVVESDWPIHYMRWVTRVDGAATGSVITQELEDAVKFGPFGWLMDQLMMRRKLTQTLDLVFKRLVEQSEGRF